MRTAERSRRGRAAGARSRRGTARTRRPGRHGVAGDRWGVPPAAAPARPRPVWERVRVGFHRRCATNRDVRIAVYATPFSTDPWVILHPQGGDPGVIRTSSTRGWVQDHQGRSEVCGIVADDPPQPVDKQSVHRPRRPLSTGGPQVRFHGPQLLHTAVHCSAAETPRFTGRSESRHTKLPGWAVGNRGKAGDRTGRTAACLCIGCAQPGGVHSGRQLSTGPTHRGGGQKTWRDLGRQGLSTVSTSPTTTPTQS